MLTGPKKLLRSARNQIHTTLPLVSERLSRKMLVLVKCELLGQFVKTLTADYKYSRWSRDSLWQQVSIQISRKVKTSS